MIAPFEQLQIVGFSGFPVGYIGVKDIIFTFEGDVVASAGESKEGIRIGDAYPLAELGRYVEGGTVTRLKVAVPGFPNPRLLFFREEGFKPLFEAIVGEPPELPEILHSLCDPLRHPARIRVALLTADDLEQRTRGYARALLEALQRNLLPGAPNPYPRHELRLGFQLALRCIPHAYSDELLPLATLYGATVMMFGDHERVSRIYDARLKRLFGEDFRVKWMQDVRNLEEELRRSL